MTKKIRIELTGPQVEALLGATAEVMAGECDHWSAGDWRALVNAREKLLQIPVYRRRGKDNDPTWLDLHLGPGPLSVGRTSSSNEG